MQSQNESRTQNHTQAFYDDFEVTTLNEDDSMALHSCKVVNERYYFRCRIPKDLLEWFKGREISKALHTSDKKQVRALIADWTTKVTKVFYILRLTTVDELFKREIVRSEIYPSSKNLTAGKSIRLSQLITEYRRSHNDAWTDKTKKENASSYELILEIIGDIPLKHLEHENILQLKEALQKLPKNMRKMPAYRDKKVSEILAMPNVVPMSIVTANKHLGRLSTLLDYGCNIRNYISANFAANQTIAEKKGRDTNKKRTIFSDDDISKLYQVLNKFKDSPERFWIPLIALFSGMRLNEICQLYKNDISKCGDIWTISINANTPDKRLKNEGAERIVPVHNILVGLGFCEYVYQCKSERLWPNLRLFNEEGYGHYFSKWFGVLKRKHITTEESKVFHSFRHNFINLLKQKQVDHTLIATLSGHTVHTMVNEVYGNIYYTETLHKTINLIDFNKISGFNLLNDFNPERYHPTYIPGQRKLILDVD